MRIATWNVNSLRARWPKVEWWLARTQPDVVLMQETKLNDAEAPALELLRHGYQLAHHGEGRWNGVAIASRVGLTDVVANFGAPLAPAKTPDAGDDEPMAEARMIAARCGDVRVVSIYAPNGRALGTPFYEAKLEWFARLQRWCREACAPTDALVIGGDFNVAPTDLDVWDPQLAHGATHVSARERDALAGLTGWGLVDVYRDRFPDQRRYTWWDYRAGCFYKNMGIRIDLFLVTPPVASRVVAAEIDREARKGKPTPSDHAPLIIDLDTPGKPFEAGWARADAREANG